jgi:hypothetical protein
MLSRHIARLWGGQAARELLNKWRDRTAPWPYCQCFETRGVLGPTSESSPCAPAQMGRREAEREGGKGCSRREAGVREWIPRPSC